MKKCFFRRALAGLLSFCLLASGLPALNLNLSASAEDGSGSTVDAFGISMHTFTEAERAAAEQSTPYGVGYGTKTSLLTKNELFLSEGWDEGTRHTENFDLNGEGASGTALTEGIRGIDTSSMDTSSENYRFVETTAMDLNGTGKKEYVAHLGYNRSQGRLELYVTDANNSRVTNILYLNSENIGQLSSLDTYQVPGSIALAAGDFDGDGRDTLVVYFPDVKTPTIQEYSVTGTNIQKASTVMGDVAIKLGIPARYAPSANRENQAMVSLVAEDADLDGFDELVVTAGMNDVQTSYHDQLDDGRLGSQLFIYDYSKTNGETDWHESFHTDLTTVTTGSENTAADAGRLVWASSTVGNVVASTATTTADYPEIIAAGYVDSQGGENITMKDGGGALGVVTVQVSGQESETLETGVHVDPEDPSSAMAQNVVGQYGVLYRQEVEANSFTSSGAYDEDCWGLLQVQAFADRGVGAEESVFISGSLYESGDQGLVEKDLEIAGYYFDEADSYAQWSSSVNDRLKQTVVLDVVAGNFDGNDEGREQILCVTGLEKYYYQYESYSKLYCIYNAGKADENGTITDDWEYSETENYLFKSKKPCYITVAATDTGDDSTIVALNRVDRTYSEPGVLAVLEAPPYFREIGDGDTGNSQTVYGTTSTSGSGYSNNVGFSAGITFGYEADTLLGGGGWEVTIDNSFNWGFANTTEVSFSTNFANDTGDNLVVVYRSPVVGYEYLDQDGNALTITKTGLPAVNMIPVEDYNEAVAQYTSKNLDPIPDGLLSSPGDPQSYRSTTEGLDEAVEGSSDSNPSWIQYSGQGTVEQSIETTQTSENDFTYELDIQGSLWGKVFGGKLGGQAGVQYSHGISWSSGQGTLMSGSVTGQQENGYDFQWRFATWTTQLNGCDVPVLGYLVRDVVAPPSPGTNLQVSNVTETTATITWEPGTRSSQQYRIYRLTDDGVYVLVSAVSGSTYEYTLSGLLPGEPYTYVVRGVAYEEDGDEQESVDSSRLTVMTRSENAADVEILLFGAQDDGSYPTSGAEVNLSVEAIVTADYQYNTSYQWQILRPDNWKDGISNWTNLSAKEEGIESVEVDKNSLRLTGLDSSLDGARLRCRVTVPTSDATPNYYYSDAVTLEISLDSTGTSLSLSGSAAGSGSLNDPYTGNAGYSITTTISTSGEVEQDVAIPAGESHPALKVYSYTAGEESTPVYVGVGTDEGETVYYAVTKTETAEGSAAYSVGAKLELGGTKWVTAASSGSGTEEYTVPEGYDGTIETDPSTGYRRMALVKTEDSSTTFTEYWMSVPTGEEENADTQYFTDTFEPTDLTPQQEEALRYVYVGSGEGVLIVNAAEEGSDGPGADDDRYVTYAVSGGTLSAPTVFWGEADTGLYATDGEGQRTLYAGSTGLTVERETVTQEQTSTTTASYGGTEITVAAKTTVDTSILFTFANLTTGGSESVQAGADGTATWQAAVPGMYRVTATAQATETAASSTSAALYYYAGSVSEGTTAEYRLVVSKGSAPASSMVYDGSSVALTLQSRRAATAEGGTVTSPSGSWQDVEDNVSYTVLNLSGSDGEAAAMEDSAYRPQAAGTYRFTASLGGAQVTTAQLEVTRAEITIAPAWEGMEDETVPAELDDIQLTASGGFLEADQALLEQAIAIQCGLYGSDGAIRDVGGVYDVTLSYKSDGEGAAAAAELQSKYNITLESGEITYLSHSAVVNYSAGENGTLQAQYVENSEYGFASGASIPVSYGLRFVATPAVGFQFAEWTVTLNGTAVAWKDEALQGIVTFTETESAVILRVSSLKALIQAVQGESEGSGEDAAPVLQVQAAFTSQNRTVTFSVATPSYGAVTAQQDGQSLNSGVSVAHGSSVTFTATPNEGYVVESWAVNGRVEQNPDGTNYTGTTLEREIAADTSVIVTLAPMAQYAVSYEVVDESGQPVSGVAITVEGLTDGKATKGGNVAFAAQPSVGVVIQRWEVQRGDGDWETVSASANRYTLYNVQADTNVRIVASGGGSNRYTLTFGVVDDTGSPVTGGTLTATSNGVTLETGKEYPSYTNVDFTFTEAEAYEVVEWKVNTDTVQEGRGQLTYTLENPSADTTVNVVVRKKPSVTVKEVSNGTVDVTYTLDGETVQPSENGYVYTGTGISVTLAPATGYVVDAGEMEATYDVDLSYTDGSGAITDNMTYTIDNVQSDVTIAPVWEQLAAYTVGYYVVDTIGDGSGTHGALSASVERKGMDSYENSEFVSGNTVYDGSTATFTASPENGYIVQEWQVDGEAQAGNTSNTLTLSASELTADTTVTVQFREIGDKVTISAGENGEITSAIAGGVDQIDNMETGFTLDEGASVTITAQPETGYEVASWSVNGERIENTQGQNTFTYTSQSANTGAVISVEFQQVTYAVSWGAAGGTVTADGYTGTSADIRGGTEVSFTAEPAYGYELTGWTVNGEPQNGESDETFTWTVPNGQAADPAVSSYQIEALFELVDADYTLTYTVAGSGGTISVPGGENGSVTVSHGGSITFTAAPDQYYHVNEWMVDGEPVTEGVSADRTTLTLTNVTAAHTIAVSFTGAVRYDLNYAVEGSDGTVSATANGESIASDTTVQVLGGSKLVFTAAPEEGYMVARWTVNGEEVTRGNMAAYGMTSPYQNTLTVENLTSALTVRVFFEVYNGYLIPENGAGYTITDVVRTPGETYEGAPTNKIREGGDVTFTVGLNAEDGYANFSKLVINGYDCLEQTGTAADCDSVTATRNSDGSYTVTIQNLRGDIDADIEAHQLVINKGLENYDIPESLKKLEIDTPEEIQTLLSTEITGSYDGITYMDIALMYWDGRQWVVVTEMPEGGVDVVVPYDTINTEATSNDTFTVAHMLTTGENAGQVDIIEDVRKESDGLHFHVNSLSPFAISWTKYEAPVNPGGGTPSEPEEPTWPFTDVTEGDDWFYDAVAYVYENGIMAGTSETTFEPGMLLDRAMAAQLFYNLEGKPAVTGDSTFTDVTSGHWAVGAITWAAQNDIVAGIGGGLYDPDSNVTREQFAVMLYKYARFKGYDLTATGDLTQFPDAGSISSWAETALSWANGQGLINGHDNGTIDPKGSTIRAQAASIMANFDQNVAE